MADVGQEEDIEAARKKAMDCGAVGFFLEDLKKEFIEELIYRESPGSRVGKGREGGPIRADKRCAEGGDSRVTAWGLCAHPRRSASRPLHSPLFRSSLASPHWRGSPVPPPPPLASLLAC